MRSKLLLRIASILMLLHTIGHCFGALGWKKAPNQLVAETIAGMENNHFNFMGRSTTLASFYSGYGIIMIFVLIVVSLFLWILSGNIENPLAHRLLLPLAIFLGILAFTEYIYFFPFAAAFTAIAAICAAVALNRKSGNNFR